jgi:hypothetical protein
LLQQKMCNWTDSSVVVIVTSWATDQAITRSQPMLYSVAKESVRTLRASDRVAWAYIVNP